MLTLKPCPFCGGTAILVERSTALHNAGTVYCEKCEAKQPSVLEWNKRTGIGIVRKFKVIKSVTEKFCEIMDEQGHSCSEECDCWKNCGCPETEALRDAIMKALGE